MKRSTQPAFTLVELLIVIGIIAVLAGIALPVYGSMQLNAKKAQSMTNMRQLGAAALSYAGDNNGSLPAQGDATTWAAAATNTAAENAQWYNVLPRSYASNKGLGDYAASTAAFYANGSMFYVPAAQYPTNKLSAPQFAVAFNSKLATSTYTNVRLQLIQIPSQTVLFQEAGVVGEPTIPGTKQAAYSTQAYSYASRTAARYNGKALLTFCDGHAELVNGTSIVNNTDGKAFFPPNPDTLVYWSEQTSVNPGN